MLQQKIIYENKDGSTKIQAQKCPTCGSISKPYKIGITARMVVELQWLVGQSGAIQKKGVYPSDARAVDVSTAPDEIKASRTISKLRFFGLVERKTTLNQNGEEKSVQGHWMPTSKGIRFSLGLIRVSRHAIVLNNDVVAMTGDKVYCSTLSIKEGQVDDV